MLVPFDERSFFYHLPLAASVVEYVYGLTLITVINLTNSNPTLTLNPNPKTSSLRRWYSRLPYMHERIESFPKTFMSLVDAVPQCITFIILMIKPYKSLTINAKSNVINVGMQEVHQSSLCVCSNCFGNFSPILAPSSPHLR